MTVPSQRFERVYAYVRFSSGGQADGNSLERQREVLQAEILKRLADTNVTSTNIVWLEDLGLSAYHGEHASRGALGDFLADVRAGRVPRGSLFVCESVSRASRQGGFVLISLVSALLDAGLWVLLLDQGALFDRSCPPRFISVELALYAELAREESAVKARYARDNWTRRRARARAAPGSMVFTAECPRWLRAVDGRYEVLEDRAQSVREVYRLALDGYGVQRLVRHANEQRLPVPGNGNSWHISLIKRLLENPAVVGEFQPKVDADGGTRRADGEAIAGFYPSIVDRDVYDAVRELRSKRKTFPRRSDANNHNYLLGLGRCECGGTWRWLNKHCAKQPGYSQYSCSNRERFHTDCAKVGGRLFDHAFVTWALLRIPEMLATGEDPRQAKVLGAEARLADVRRARGRVMQLVETGDDDVAADVLPRLRELKVHERDLTAELEALRASAPPRGFGFDEAAEAFLPAFLDHWPDGTDEAAEAYRVRSLFKARVVQAVAGVVVARDRRSVTVTLRNDTVETFELPDPREVSYAPALLPVDELVELDRTRQLQLRQSQHISNVPQSHPNS